jgi:hypothetical protein
VRYAGAFTKANVGMSNDKTGGNPVRRKTKDSLFNGNQNRVSRVLRISREVNSDGKPVNIPAPVLTAMG